MKKTATNQDLVNLITDLEKQGPAFTLFNEEKIKRFYQNNAIRIQRVRTISIDLANKYGVKNEKDELIIDQATNAITFATPEDNAAFKSEWKEAMSQQIEIIT